MTRLQSPIIDPEPPDVALSRLKLDGLSIPLDLIAGAIGSWLMADRLIACAIGS